MSPARTVLHVLPHPGGGGETYIDALSPMHGYQFERVYLAPSAQAAGNRASILRKSFQVQKLARGHDVLHVHGEIAGAICLPGLAFRPSVLTLHGLHLLRRVVGLRRAMASANLRTVVRTATRTICVSHAEFVDVRRVVSARMLQRVVVIRNGIKALAPATGDERAEVRRELGIPDEAIVGVSIGALDEHKDPLVPVRAAIEIAREAVVPLALLVAGDGPLRSELEGVVHESGTEIVRVLGFRSDVERILRAADFLVLASRREGLSFAVLEAMSLGLPAVVSDAPGNHEAVGDAGIVVARGDVGGFADAFRRLLNEPERRLLGNRARDRISREFRADEMIQSTRDVYDLVARPERG